jgi:restriction system protein
MECLGPQCAAMLLDWLRHQAAGTRGDDAESLTAERPRQPLLWKSAPYSEDAPAITSLPELAGAIEHLQYAVFRRYQNQLTRAERARLDNSIDNALFKIDRYLPRLDPRRQPSPRPRSAS